MDFLQICQKVDTMSGIQGMIQSVANTRGAQSVIVEAVQEGFVELQNERMEWEFMRFTQLFDIVKDKNEYEVRDIFGSFSLIPTYLTTPPTTPPVSPRHTSSASGKGGTSQKAGPADPHATPPAVALPVEYREFGRWQRKHPYTSYYITDLATRKRSRLVFMDFRTFRDQFPPESTARGKPRFVTANERNNNLLFHPVPKEGYEIAADYFVEPQTLTENTDIPILPSRFHLLLAYRGLERVGAYYSNPNLFHRYSSAEAQMTGDLLRDQNPSQFVTIREVA